MPSLNCNLLGQQTKMLSLKFSNYIEVKIPHSNLFLNYNGLNFSSSPKHDLRIFFLYSQPYYTLVPTKYVLPLWKYFKRNKNHLDIFSRRAQDLMIILLKNLLELEEFTMPVLRFGGKFLTKHRQKTILQSSCLFIRTRVETISHQKSHC